MEKTEYDEQANYLIENNYGIVSAKNILPENINELEKKNDELSIDSNQICDDLNQIVIRKKNDENIVYKQNVFIRWLQPPTPPPLAPIISKLNMKHKIMIIY